jgi:hypothetical protein
VSGFKAAVAQALASGMIRVERVIDMDASPAMLELANVSRILVKHWRL